MNLRQELEARGLLYQMTNENFFDLYEKGGEKFYCGYDPTALIYQNAVIGPGTRISKDAVIGSNAVIGDHVVIGPGAFISRDAKIRSNVKIGSNVVIYPGSRIDSDRE